jgi:hypothetical protein
LGSPTLLYCGADDCLRIPVLRVAGFRVARCASLAELERRLVDEPGIAMVLFEEGRGNPADSAAALARKHSSAALVLFRHPAGDSSESMFDRVIDPATPPAKWLQQVAEMLLTQAGFAHVTTGWARIARNLQSRRQDLLLDEGSDRGYRIQPEQRKCT